MSVIGRSRKKRKYEDEELQMIELGEDSGEKSKKKRISNPKLLRSSKSEKKPIKRSISELGQSIRKRSNTPIDPPKDCEQWIDKYRPLQLNGVAIHPRKLQEVREKLKKMLNQEDSTRLLVLSGPSGCSKSTVIRLLSEELLSGRKLLSLANFYSESVEKRSWIEYENTDLSETTKIRSFTEFLSDASYQTDSVVIIEDLPNVFHDETKFQFQKALLGWIYTNKPLPPLVLCLTETEIPNDSDRMVFSIENSLNADTLLGRELTSNSKVSTIKFNPIAKTYMMKTLKRIMESEAGIFSKIPHQETSQFLENIVQRGDIRSAISCLEFWSCWRQKNSNFKDERYLSLGRESQLNLFHAIGKVIFGSAKSGSLSEEVSTEYSSDYFTTKEVLDSYPKNSLLHLSLLENYCTYGDKNYSLEDASKISENLSASDLIANMEEGSEVAIRGTRCILRQVQDSMGINTGDSGRHGSRDNMIKISRHFKSNREARKIRNQVLGYQLDNGKKYSFDDCNLYVGFYEPIILNSTKRKRVERVQRKYVPRLGGSFKKILLDSVMPIYHEEDVVTPISIIDTVEAYESASELSDPIQTSEQEQVSDDAFSDSFDGEIDNMLSQVPPTQSLKISTHPMPHLIEQEFSSQEILSDSDIDNV